MALTVIEDSLGAPAAHFFTDLNADVEPIAAASLGQVYKLTRKADGATVAVKVQRCGKRAVWGIAAFMPPPQTPPRARFCINICNVHPSPTTACSAGVRSHMHSR